MRLVSSLICWCFLLPVSGWSQNTVDNTGGAGKKDNYSSYLFVYFTGNDKAEEAIRFALSDDGYHYRALNNNEPVISSAAISSTGGVRDPHILRGADGKYFYMVATDMVSANGWNSNRAMVLLKSKDLVHWTSSVINIQKDYPGNDNLLRVWAPQTIYDPVAKKYMIYFSMKHGNDPDKVYYAYANKDFTAFEAAPQQLFFSPTNNACIDADIVAKDGEYHLFFKTEDGHPGIKKAVSDHLTGGYTMKNDQYLQQTNEAVEGSGTFKLNGSDEWILMYDMYMRGKYQFTKSTDLEHFTVIDKDITMDFHPRHGTVMPITAKEAERLVKQWGTAGFVTGMFTDALLTPQATEVKSINVAADEADHSVVVPVKPGTNLAAFDPGFTSSALVKISPAGKANFAGGPVNYTLRMPGKDKQTFTVTAVEWHNPVLPGYYADPEILYAHKTGKFYIYPTSDGFTGWSGNYFKTFSSPDLVHWTDEGKILDLPTQVSWASRNAWAPCIIEKKINGVYKYFYYFSAAQKVGVAVADDPTGPFKDMGHPLLDHLPDGVRGGQQIDPDVFEDPATGKDYLYWGNGYMAGAELNEDMTSLKPGTTTILKPDRTYREGTYVFYRKGRYYFMWSEDDTRSPNYRVRYGFSDSPLGKITIPANNLVIAKDTAAGIYGTGHNSVLQIPGRDEWYIVYHRFNYPRGITMGDAAGYNREVCIDHLEFNEDGTIKQVIPTQKGIEPVKVQ